MLELSALLTNDNITAACIGSAFTVIGALVGAFVAFWLNLNIEKRKTRNKKIEELVYELEKLKHSMLKNILVIKKEASMERNTYFESRKLSDEHINELTKPNSITVAKLICKIHFKDLIDSITTVESKNDEYIDFCAKARRAVYESKLTDEVKEVSIANAIAALEGVVNEIKSLIDIVVNKAN
ncbi:TPA: hypothetical protein SMF67_003773 [Serratia marcescens]|uniref:hypothetical protein n=2 Tax=Serratia marcescens TaxID=615 RepID=UPI00131A4F6F|nr:hypothetical protein [Serratia marcescens]MBH2835604.1 hypothetical protein [Serratia marcescens]MCG5374655.1 hypothetical protein [Serratia marcescens]HBH6923242.1 hypothetical protein [Serratia marcescens]HEJ7093072.1 hypothetical protein [Serratia marcescens]